MIPTENSHRIDVCLFFYVHGQFLIHGCPLEEAEIYGDFLIYPESHFDIWETHYYRKFGVDYDFFPRGRVAYHRNSNSYQLLYDSCIGDDIQTFIDAHYENRVSMGHDEHYQCHKCNQGYIL